MPTIVKCEGCGHESIYVYKCSECGEIRCFFPLCKGNKGSKKEGAAITGKICINCESGMYIKISV